MAALTRSGAKKASEIVILRARSEEPARHPLSVVGSCSGVTSEAGDCVVI
jgi:hypothetical protein